MISFGSDNHAGIHPEILAAIEAANRDFTPAYGGDPWTEKLGHTVKKVFGSHACAFPVFNGTGANVVALSTSLKRHEGVIAIAKAHIDADECGAPEKIGGFKLLTAVSPDQKLRPAQIFERLTRRGDPHAVQPRMISVTQSTELGTVYSLEELRALSRVARAENLLFHMDGARIANAAASLGCSLAECTTEVGVDVLSFGGTKNGALAAEAVIGLSENYIRNYGDDLRYAQKQGMQLASKMRFFSAQLLALFEDELWRKNALHSNAMANLLASEARKSGIEITQSVEANAVFARLPLKIVPSLQSKFSFYIWDDSDAAVTEKVIVRWMTSFQTREEDVRAFGAAIASEAL